MTPKPRKIKHRTHKNFGSHSRIIQAEDDPASTGGRSVGSKQILPGDYGNRQTGGYGDHRTRAERRNDAEINHTPD